MNVARRVQELEKRIGGDDNKTLMRVAFVGCRPDETGSQRAIKYPVTGFRTDGRRWHQEEGETEEQLWDRAKSEVEYNQCGVAVLMECYAEDLAAS